MEKIKGDELKIFILSRKQDIPKSKLPKKGKLDDAIKGEEKLISVDFWCKKMNCIANEQLCEAIAEVLYKEEDDVILFSIKMHVEGNNKTVKASTLSGNTHWINELSQVFGLLS